jgi:hypothetical protein
MSLSLAYDATLSRVRATGTVPGVYDSFDRTTSNGWGTATVGPAWTVVGTASEYSTNGSRAAASAATVNAYRIGVLDVNLADSDAVVSFQTAAAPAGASQIFELAARYADTSNFLAARVELQTTGAMFSTIRKVVANVSTSLASVTMDDVYQPATWYSVRFRVVGSVFQMKLWRTVDEEPDGWTLITSDLALPGAGDLALRAALASGNTNTLPVVYSFENLSVNADAVLERSTDQIRWTSVRGGVDLGLPGSTYIVDDYEFVPGVINYYRLRATGSTVAANITPTIDRVWIKNLSRPFLNTAVRVADWDDVEWPDRNEVFEIVGRSRPLAVTDVRLSRLTGLTLVMESVAEASDFADRMAGGDPVFIQVPPDCPVPSMYAVVGKLRESHKRPTSQYRYFELPLTEVAAPAPEVVGATSTWQTVINTWATWADVIAANATWQDLLDGVADPEDVIVP